MNPNSPFSEVIKFASEFSLLELGLFSLVCALSVIVSQYSSDLSSLKTWVRNSLRSRSSRGFVALQTQSSKELFSSLLSLSGRLRSYGSNESTTSQLKSTSRFASLADSVDDLCAELVRVVLENVECELDYAAVLFPKGLREEEHVELSRVELVDYVGINKSAEGFLLELFDSCRDNERWGKISSSDIGWGSEELSRAVFSAPLSIEDKVCGCLILGFQRETQGLSPQEISKISSITEHASACLSAAARSDEKISQKKRERDFLLGLSHDMRAPGAVASYALADILSDSESLPAETIEKLTLAQSSLKQQRDYISDMFDFFRYKQGALESDTEVFSLYAVLSDVKEAFLKHSEKVEIEILESAREGISISFDRKHLYRILSNLISNAIKYGDGSTIKIGLDSPSQSLQGTGLFSGRFRLFVRDGGVGVSVEDQKLLFKEFSRLGSNSEVEGLGLGLSLCKILAGSNGCEMSYRPLQDEPGSEFGMLIPGRLISKASSGECSELSASVEAPGKPVFGSALIVDDDPRCIRAHRRLLEGSVSHFYQAESLEKARREFQSRKPELVICDFRLERATAREFVEEVLRDSSHCLVVTGQEECESLASLREQGALVLGKPISRQTLVESLRNLNINR